MKVYIFVTDHLTVGYGLVCDLDEVEMHVRHALDNGHEIKCCVWHGEENDSDT